MGAGCEEFFNSGDIVFKVQQGVEFLGKVAGGLLLGDRGEFFVFIGGEEVGWWLVLRSTGWGFRL